ncbi:hypothetical protein ACFFQW_05850 [Umezawaea endophytica]|uniref:Tetratricopeptide repeat protein n=1 Tax=Umezawaea endophytica TaxID=1654476 RepID=A0A9X2VQU6_9PSEU|nr:hypothetical protein [Umezawaea endophytica]MCS7481150.1 hypothetical protein [Umezawaea endophytica]
MDPDNTVVRLCGEGMRAEAAGRPEEAKRLFLEAWDAAGDDYEACVAAHYVARHQGTPEDVLRWNVVCLDRADAVGDERVRGFYPSLHLNIARAQRDLGDPDEARRHYLAAADRVADVPAGPYGDGIRFAVAEGLRSTGRSDLAGPADLEVLVAKLCARADLKALGLLLPAHLGNLGTAEDWTRLLTAAQMVHASRSLPDDEQDLLGRAVGELTAKVVASTGGA